MIKDVPSLQYNAEKRLSANEGGFGLLGRIDDRTQKLEAHFQKLESHRQSHLNLRQRAIRTWVRDAVRRMPRDEIHRLNKDIIHDGDVRSDAMIVTERYKKNQHRMEKFPHAIWPYPGKRE